MDSNTKSSAILFVDICDSTRLFETLGDAQALSMTSRCLRIMEDCVLNEGGVIQQAQGDGLLCTFDSVNDALQAAQTIQKANQGGPLSVHAGLHYGPVILQPGAIYGDAVNVAARMQGIAKKGETILSEDAWVELSPNRRETLRPLGRVTVKGKGHLIRIFLAVVQALDQTIIQAPFENTRDGWACLKIDDGRNLYEIEAPASNFVLGRHQDCDLTLNHKYVSRRHATIECMRGKFFLVDHSTNGCYVNEENQPYKFIRREMLQLHGQGNISLGIDPAENSNYLIRYLCDE